VGQEVGAIRDDRSAVERPDVGEVGGFDLGAVRAQATHTRSICTVSSPVLFTTTWGSSSKGTESSIEHEQGRGFAGRS